MSDGQKVEIKLDEQLDASVKLIGIFIHDFPNSFIWLVTLELTEDGQKTRVDVRYDAGKCIFIDPIPQLEHERACRIAEQFTKLCYAKSAQWFKDAK